MRLRGSRALITGSSRGIGRGIAVKLAEEGASVAVHYLRNQAAADETAQMVRSHGVEAVVVQGDVTVPERVRGVVKEAAERLGGGLDILVNNARPELPDFFAGPDELTLDQWNTAMDSQAKAFLIASQEAAQWMADGGRVIALTYATGSATGGLQPWIAMGAAKAAMMSAVRYLAVAFAGRGITVNAISPGWTEDTVLTTLPPHAQDLLRDWHRQGWTPMRRLGTPADVGNVAALLCSEEAGFVTGQTLVADGGASLMNPEVPPQLQLPTDA